MILSVCPNPCLDVYYYTDVLKEDDTNRVENPLISPGGKGVNAARVISRFCDDSYLALPLGGCIGSCVRELLEKEGVVSIITETESETRVNTILEQRAKGKHILIASRGAPLSESETEKLKTSICKECSPKVLILGGSVPPSLPKDFYAEIVDEFKGTKTKTIVDADGELLKKAVEKGPFAVKPNKHELERLVGHPLLSIEDIVRASQWIRNFGVEVVIVSLGEHGALCTFSEGVFRIIPPKVEVKNTVGAGDSVVGGFAYGIYSGMPILESVKFGVACGTATVMEEGTKLCSPRMVNQVLEKIKVERIGEGRG